jgi:Na+-driven multidrug efflux pump
LDIGAWTAFTLAVARFDPVQSAANLIGISLIRISFMPAFGVSKAAATLVGQYLGAKDVPSAARSGWTSASLTSVYMVAAGICYFVFRKPLVALFTSDPAVVIVGARLMVWASLFQLGDGLQLVLAGALRGAGDTKFVMWASLTGAWAVFAPLAFTLMIWKGMGVESGWIAINAWVIVLASLLAWRFRSGVWTKGGINLEPRPMPAADVV